MDHPEGAGKTDDARLGFAPRAGLEFHGSKISSDGGLLLFRELDDVLGLQGRDTERHANWPQSPAFSGWPVAPICLC